MVLKVYLGILLVALFYATEFLITLQQLRKYLQKLYKASKLVYQLIKIYAENQSHHQSHQQYLMKVLKLLQYHFLFLILIYQVANLIILSLKRFIESFYIKAKNKIRILLQFLVNLKQFLLLLQQCKTLLHCYLIQFSKKFKLLFCFWIRIKCLLFT